jgi:hypothetical protein
MCVGGFVAREKKRPALGAGPSTPNCQTASKAQAVTQVASFSPDLKAAAKMIAPNRISKLPNALKYGAKNERHGMEHSGGRRCVFRRSTLCCSTVHASQVSKFTVLCI